MAKPELPRSTPTPCATVLAHAGKASSAFGEPGTASPADVRQEEDTVARPSMRARACGTTPTDLDQRLDGVMEGWRLTGCPASTATICAWPAVDLSALATPARWACNEAVELANPLNSDVPAAGGLIKWRRCGV